MPKIDLQIFLESRIKFPSTTALRVKTIEGPPTISSPIFSKQVVIGFSKRMEFGTGRFLETNIRQIRKCTPELQHVNAFLVIRSNQFLHCFECWGNVFDVVPAQKVFKSAHILMIP